MASAGTGSFPPDRAREIAHSFDLRRLTSEFYENPFPVYRALREHDPVRLMPDGSYFLTRYADVDAVYHDTRTFSSDKQVEFGAKYGTSPLFEHHTTSLVFNDAPLHTRVRRIIAGALTPRAIAAREPDIVALVDRLLDAMQARRDVDLVTDFAAAIPVEVIGNLLAVPVAEREPLRDWSLAILGALEPVLSDEVEARGNRAVREFLGYLSGLVADRRARPGDRDRDVLTRLIEGGPNGDQLLEHELLHNCIFILNAGHETTTNLIANSLHTLTIWHAERARLQANPTMIKTAVEEFLRFESSNQLGNRITTAPATVGGRELPAGALITLGIGAANRDPAQFPDPDRLDITRAPNRHLAFASGAHQCIGMSLARLEGQVAISRFLARFPDYRLSAEPVRGGRARFRGFASLPATVA
jgi:cytochrome P450